MKPKVDVISARSSLFSFAELTKYRELFWTLAWRDFKVRYAQTAVGVAWGVLQPVITLLILNVVFDRFAGVESEGLPHIVYTSCGLMAWTYFAFVLTNSGNSIIGAQGMVKKIYFPRLIIPTSKAVVGLIDKFIAALILVALMLFYGISVSWNIIYLPVFVLLNIMAALGVGIWLSALSIRFRDVQHIIPFIVQLGLYITPVAYPSQFAISRLPSWASFLYFLNPLAGITEGYRWCILGTEPPHAISWISFASVILLFIGALFYFRKVDATIADIV